MNKQFFSSDIQNLTTNVLARLRFFEQFLHAPARTGSICPSSQFLVHELADMALADKSRTGIIVDLGAGSGVVSQELLKRGIEPQNILALDISEHCRKVFNKTCPGLTLHINDARNLDKIINCHYPNRPIRAVISSLPLRSLPAKIVYEIMLTLWRLLRFGGNLIQFTYAFWQHAMLEQFGFKHMDRHYVPLNLPPALVEKYAAK